MNPAFHTRYTGFMLDLTETEEGILLPVKIVPGASRTRYLGLWDRRARIAVAVPPLRGRANKAVEAFLAKRLGLKRRDVCVVAGHTSPEKTVRIEQVTLEAVRAAFAPDRF